MEKHYSIAQFAELSGISKSTLRRYDKENKLKPAYTSSGGHRRYTESQLFELIGKKNNTNKINIGYVRVSSKKQIDNLERQYTLMESYLISKGKPFEIIKSISSGINYNNPSLNDLVDMVISGRVNKVFIMYKDRLVRFGFELLQSVFKRYGVEIEVINQQNNTIGDELVTDLIQLVTDLSPKLNSEQKHIISKFTRELENEQNRSNNSN
jgi:transposon, resolvase